MYEDLLDTDEDRFIYSCCLYEMAEKPVMSDPDFDALCRRMLDRYTMLCPKFQARVPRSNLECGSAIGLRFTEREKREASTWRLAMDVQTLGNVLMRISDAADELRALTRGY